MENIKFGLISIIILGLLVFVGFWAFQTIESGSSHISNQELKELKEENKNLKEEIFNLKNQITILESKIIEEVPVVIEEEAKIETPKPVETTVLKYQSLINELQKLIDNNIYMKKGSQGPQVGTIQKFFNLYNKTSTRIDNDYGAGVEALVKKFQTAEKLSADGEVGPNTYRKMIDWLKKQ
ncbi:MAG: peptidoglycan-binding protein [Vampirovibrionia bacterium]